MSSLVNGRTTRERVLSRLIIDPETGCLLWTGKKGSGGYSHVKIKGKTTMVHRLMYEWFVGPIPEGLQIDHLCRVRNCAAPAHLEAVTPQVNTLRCETVAAACAAATHCGTCGTAYDEINTYRTPDGRRDCRRCRNASSVRSRARRAVA